MGKPASLSKIRITLLLEHASLRRMIAEGRELLSRGQRGERVEGQLATLVARLDRAFEEHNANEEAALASFIANVDLAVPARVAQVAAEHIQEHRDLRALLASEEPDALGDALASLEDHLDTEERLFLDARVADHGAASVTLS